MKPNRILPAIIVIAIYCFIATLPAWGQNPNPHRGSGRQEPQTIQEVK